MRLDERLAVTRLARAQARTRYWTKDGQAAAVGSLASAAGGTDQRTDVVRVADEHRSLMCLLIIRDPQEVAQRRRADLEAEARRTKPTDPTEGLLTRRVDDPTH